MRTFTFSDATSHKFWNIEQAGKSFTVTYGKIGSNGQTQVKKFPDEAKALKEHDKLVQEKLKKGYAETTSSAAAPASLREALELALVAHPGDLASHMAYADYLEEQGDPLGELIRVQLALEDAGKPAAERTKLQKQEKKLLKAHARAWLGDLAPFLLDQEGKKEHRASFKHVLARGWLDSVEAEEFGVDFARALARAPQARLLRRLVLRDDRYVEPDEYEPGPDIPEDPDGPQLHALTRSPYLGNVRVLVVGELLSPNEELSAREGGFNCQTAGEAAVGLVRLMPRLEELRLLCRNVDGNQLFALKSFDNLRVLQLYHGTSYPLAKLAVNPSLKQLTHLLFHPHALDDDKAYVRLNGVKALVRSAGLPALTHLQLRLSDMGDKGVKEIIDSGILKRLRVLDLRHGCITDKGAKLLADCPDLKHLELLDLHRNNLTEAGIAALQATGVKFDASHQWKEGGDYEFGSGEHVYLYDGDIE